jgi:hypothetical protein
MEPEEFSWFQEDPHKEKKMTGKIVLSVMSTGKFLHHFDIASVFYHHRCYPLSK